MKAILQAKNNQKPQIEFYKLSIHNERLMQFYCKFFTQKTKIKIICLFLFNLNIVVSTLVFFIDSYNKNKVIKQNFDFFHFIIIISLKPGPWFQIAFSKKNVQKKQLFCRKIDQELLANSYMSLRKRNNLLFQIYSILEMNKSIKSF